MIGELIENLPLLIIPGYLIWLMIGTISNINKGTTISKLKYLFCLFVTIAIMISVMIILVFQVYQIGIIWKTYELTQPLNPLVKSISFGTLEFIWSLIAVVLSHYIFKTIYHRQLIPGTGTIRERIKHNLKRR